MSDAYMGQILPWPINWAPKSWALCWGQLLSISQYSALYSLLGTTYGGNGTTTFSLPDLRGRVIIGAGKGPGLTNYYMGQMGGFESIKLADSNLPVHTHLMPASSSTASVEAPDTTVALAAESATYKLYAPTIDTNLAPTGLNGTTDAPVDNRQPFEVPNYIICVQGLYPPRN